MALSDQTILVTGGAGFIGTHTVVQLLSEGSTVWIIDNLDNSSLEAMERVRDLVGAELSQKLHFNLVCDRIRSCLLRILRVFSAGNCERRKTNRFPLFKLILDFIFPQSLESSLFFFFFSFPR